MTLATIKILFSKLKFISDTPLVCGHQLRLIQELRHIWMELNQRGLDRFAFGRKRSSHNRITKAYLNRINWRVMRYLVRHEEITFMASARRVLTQAETLAQKPVFH